MQKYDFRLFAAAKFPLPPTPPRPFDKRKDLPEATGLYVYLTKRLTPAKRHINKTPVTFGYWSDSTKTKAYMWAPEHLRWILVHIEDIHKEGYDD